MKHIYTFAFLVCCMYTNAQDIITRKNITVSLSKDTIWIIHADSLSSSKVEFEYMPSNDKPRNHGLSCGQKVFIIPATTGEKKLIVYINNEKYTYELAMIGSGKEEDFIDVITFKERCFECNCRHD